MATFKDFFPDKAPAAIEKTFRLDGWEGEFAAKQLTEQQMSAIRKQCRTHKKDRFGNITEETDSEKLTRLMIVETVTTPNFNDAALQDAWGVMGAEALIQKMFLAGSYSELAVQVSEVNGYIPAELEGARETAKN